MTREYREAIKRFMGDPKLAVQYTSVARTILGGLIQQLRLGGIEYGHRIVNLPDGAMIRVMHNSGINTIEIDVSVGTEKQKGGASSSGFVFYPMIDNNRLYPYDLPHATMAVKCNEKAVKLTVTAPVKKEYGNQFVFFGEDVYSWEHSDSGDMYSAFSGFDVIYKNGVAWQSIGKGVIGVLPVIVDVVNEAGQGIKLFRFLITTASFDKVSNTALRCYQESDDKLVEIGTAVDLLPDKILVYDRVWWPCRFKADGLEAAMLYRHTKTVAVKMHDGGYTYSENLPVQVYQSVIAEISHTIDGISAKLIHNEEGTKQDWTLRNINRVDKFVNSVSGGNGEYQLDKTDVATLGYEYFVYPVALNYSIDGTLKKAFIREHVSGGYDVKRVLNRKLTQDVNNSTGRITRTNKGTYTSVERNNNRRSIELIIDGAIVISDVFDYSSEHTTSASIDAYSEERNQRRISSFQELQQDELSTAQTGGYLVGVRYASLRDNTFLLGVDSFRVETKVSIHYAQNEAYPDASKNSLVNTGNKIVTRIYNRKYIMVIHGERKPDIISEKAPVVGKPVQVAMNIFALSEDSSAVKSYTFSYTASSKYKPPVDSGSLGVMQFSYALDERLVCDKPVLAYSVNINDNYRTAPFIESICTFGSIGPYLPVVGADSKPTDTKLTDPTLTVYPIGLY